MGDDSIKYGRLMVDPTVAGPALPAGGFDSRNGAGVTPDAIGLDESFSV
jgi:hypothetical protein